MTTLEQIILHSQKLPETLQNEILDFTTFLEAKYLSQTIQMDIDTQVDHSVWPSAIRNLAGAWTDFPTAEEIRKSLGEDLSRKPF